MFQESWYCAYPLCHSRCIIYILNPTSNHNVVACEKAADRLYIFWFLHQTTTYWLRQPIQDGCISFDSYIKPQRKAVTDLANIVVYLLIPTSNHNTILLCLEASSVVYLLIPTSNHNCSSYSGAHPSVVYLLIPTSNHNWTPTKDNLISLYIFWCLHQTTTLRLHARFQQSCISFDSYIKPQLVLVAYLNPFVVYLLIPTSNHNEKVALVVTDGVYIFWFLHQTTTFACFWKHAGSCISFDSYIKPQRSVRSHRKSSVVYLLIPTSNHNWNLFLA